MGRISAARGVVDGANVDTVFVKLHVVVAADALNLVTASFMDEADIELQFAAAVMPQIGVTQPEFAAVAADAGAGVGHGWRHVCRRGRGNDGRHLHELGVGCCNQRAVDPGVLAAVYDLPPSTGRVFAGNGVLVSR